MANADNELLLARPMDFFKRYAVSPPDDAGSRTVPVPGRLATLVANQTLTKSLELWSDPNHTVLPPSVERIDYQQVIGGKVVWADVTTVERDKPGAKTFKITMEEADGLVPIYYLPWCSGKLMEMRLPDVGADMDNIAEHPRLFFTAALSGCSVFVDGHPARPRIVHAGINGALKTDAVAFWRDMLNGISVKTGRPIDDHLREANKLEYMNTPWAMGFKQFLQADHRDTMEIREVKEWASVFGIRFGRLWSFYLQRNATATTYRLVKKSDTTILTHKYTKEKFRVVKNQPHLVVASQVQKGHGFFSRDKTIHVVKEDVALPLMIDEFYPTGQAHIKPERRIIAT
ncbi:hypothetical protein [uncultured Xylophilus sp.]|uniref:hypothetical protein n=1 Tax=uncultured Xylophilus sp. TaxID=296832 RepID=UPI0025DCC737|nr:hypothetical protein [uncultured Xylophilus sp.]